MVKFCLMASHGYLPGLVFHREQGMCKVVKDDQSFLPNPGAKQELIRSNSPNLRPLQNDEQWNPISGFLVTNRFFKIDSSIRRPVLIDVQDTRPDSVLFSFGIAEQCRRREKILQFLMFGSREVDGGGLDLSLLSDLMGPQTLTIDEHQQLFASSDYKSCYHEAQPSLIYPSRELHAQKPLVDFVGDLSRNSKFKVHPDGQVSFTGTRYEMKDLLSIVAEFYLSKNSIKWRNQSVLVPHLSWLDNSSASCNIQVSPMKHEAVKVAPVKSPEKVKIKSPKKKNSRKAFKERDLYQKNYFHACESLLSIMIYKRRHGKTAILSLKKSGPELPQLLTQFSAGIAGTGLAVLFSVVTKVASGRVPFCASKVLNTGFGFGLVWLSWAVNRLSDTIVHISKNSGKLCLNEEEVMKRVDTSVKEIFFRAAALMVVALLRFA